MDPIICSVFRKCTDALVDSRYSLSSQILALLDKPLAYLTDLRRGIGSPFDDQLSSEDCSNCGMSSGEDADRSPYGVGGHPDRGADGTGSRRDTSPYESGTKWICSSLNGGLSEVSKGFLMSTIGSGIDRTHEGEKPTAQGARHQTTDYRSNDGLCCGGQLFEFSFQSLRSDYGSAATKLHDGLDVIRQRVGEDLLSSFSSDLSNDRGNSWATHKIKGVRSY